MFISAFAEIASLGAVVPFLGILVSPERVLDHYLVGKIVQNLGINSTDQLLFLITLIFIVFAVIAGLIRIFSWASARIAFATGADLGSEVYKRTLYQPYWVHASQNSSEVISGIVTKTNLVVFDVLMPLLLMMSATLLVVAIMATLLS